MIDPKRVAAAMKRADLALQAARHHDRQAAAERAKAETLARTWGFGIVADATYCPTTDLDEDAGVS